MRKVGAAYVRRCYNRFKERYFPDRELPEWDEFEFDFIASSTYGEWGRVEFEEDGSVHALYLDEALQMWSASLKLVLLHEMVHMFDKSKAYHGKKFYEEVLRALKLGAVYECF
jgi:hypothetical protein